MAVVSIMIINSLLVVFLSQLTSKFLTYTNVFVVRSMSNRVLPLFYESVPGSKFTDDLKQS